MQHGPLGISPGAAQEAVHLGTNAQETLEAFPDGRINMSPLTQYTQHAWMRRCLSKPGIAHTAGQRAANTTPPCDNPAPGGSSKEKQHLPPHNSHR